VAFRKITCVIGVLKDAIFVEVAETRGASCSGMGGRFSVTRYRGASSSISYPESPSLHPKRRGSVFSVRYELSIQVGCFKTLLQAGNRAGGRQTLRKFELEGLKDIVC
jgi:hypothetical protein